MLGVCFCISTSIIAEIGDYCPWGSTVTISCLHILTLPFMLPPVSIPTLRFILHTWLFPVRGHSLVLPCLLLWSFSGPCALVPTAATANAPSTWGLPLNPLGFLPVACMGTCCEISRVFFCHGSPLLFILGGHLCSLGVGAILTFCIHTPSGAVALLVHGVGIVPRGLLQGGCSTLRLGTLLLSLFARWVHALPTGKVLALGGWAAHACLELHTRCCV